ncbi:MAG: hypothetical protein D6748_00250 [Calditrichaeota bacterium]|nr:MAG: hypothetical protein D6748_00250 [Calditrichota bacterium]
MMKIKFFVLLFFSIYLISCVSQSLQTVPPETKVPEEEKLIDTDAGKILTVEVAKENVRDIPNGKVLGKLFKGEKIRVVRRVGNWIQFTHEDFGTAYIWAPSVGYTYQNLYSPYFYFDTTTGEFRDIEYFQNFFSKTGQRRQDMGNSYEVFFKDIGLGSHESTILDVVTETEQVVEHGITLFINKKTGKIEKVRVDYFKPVKGYETALKKSELPILAPSRSDSGHLIWKEGVLVKGLIIDLERKEWDSDWFSSIWYILPQNSSK